MAQSLTNQSLTKMIIKRGSELSTADIVAWQQLQRARSDLRSPYFSPDFFLAIAAISRTARVLICERAGVPVAFLPFHRTASGVAVPIGGPLNDLHGLIGAPDPALPAEDLLTATGMSLMSLRHAPIGTPAFGRRTQPHAFHVVDLSAGFAAWDDERRGAAKSAFRAIRTRADKAAKAYGSIAFQFDDTSATAMTKLMAWKRAQYAQTKQPDPLARPWVRALLDRLHQADGTAPLRGQLSTLWFGDRLAAVHFGLRSSDVLHYWFPAYDPEFAELSPGNLLLYRMIAAAAADGCQAFHLGAGDVRYKLEFANLAIPVIGTAVFAGSLAGRTAATAGRLIDGLGAALPERWREHPAKALRRLDRVLSLNAA